MRPTWKLLTIFVLMTTACLAIDARAQGHTIRPQACQQLSQRAIPGARFETLVKCQHWVQEHKLAHECSKPRPIIWRMTVKHVRANRKQRDVATRILNTGRKMRATPKAMIASIAASTQESGIAELRHGHSSSLGPLQLLDYHGTTWQRINAEYSARWFFRGIQQVSQRGSIGQLAQRVQRSRYPDAYDQWVSEAKRTYRTYLGACKR